MIDFEEIKTRIDRPKFTPEQTAKLKVPISIEQIALKPDGVLYCSSNTVRDILNDAIGYGQWAVYKNDPYDVNNGGQNCTLIKGELWALGCYIGSAIGEHTGNDYMSYGSKIESASSDLITKLGKYLGIASELWDRTFVAKFKKDHCSMIEVVNKAKSKKEKREVTEWIWIKKGAIISYPYEAKKTDNKKESEEPAEKTKLDEIKAEFSKFPAEASFSEKVRELMKKFKPEVKTDLLAFVDSKEPTDAKKITVWESIRKEVEDWK